MKTADSQWGQGQCYILSQNLESVELRKPCSGKPTNKYDEQTIRVSCSMHFFEFLIFSSFHDFFDIFLRAHEQFGYCQAGTSGLFTSEDRVVIGTPGPHTWRGTLYLFTVSDEFLTRDNTIYNAPMQDASPVNKYSYLGKLTSRKKEVLVLKTLVYIG